MCRRWNFLPAGVGWMNKRLVEAVLPDVVGGGGTITNRQQNKAGVRRGTSFITRPPLKATLGGVAGLRPEMRFIPRASELTKKVTQLNGPLNGLIISPRLPDLRLRKRESVGLPVLHRLNVQSRQTLHEMWLGVYAYPNGFRGGRHLVAKGRCCNYRTLSAKTFAKQPFQQVRGSDPLPV